jgi:Mg-chelatase subunit ChlD
MTVYAIGTGTNNLQPVLVEMPEHDKRVLRGQRLAYGVTKKTCYQHGAAHREWQGWFWTAQDAVDAGASVPMATLKALHEQGRVWWVDRSAAGSGGRSVRDYSEGVRLDVVMVMDRSGSMAGAMADLKEAAKTLVNTMNPLHDQVAVVSFSDTVTVDQPLTGNFAAARAQIDNLQAEGYTHTGDGLAAAWAHLEAVKREDTTPVILLFADGVNTGGANPQTVAADIKSQGVRIFVIGLGGADPTELQAIASPGDYYYTPSASELVDIYREVALTLGNAVPVEVYWAGHFAIRWENPLTESAIVSFHLIEVAGYVSQSE